MLWWDAPDCFLPMRATVTVALGRIPLEQRLRPCHSRSVTHFRAQSPRRQIPLSIAIFPTARPMRRPTLIAWLSKAKPTPARLIALQIRSAQLELRRVSLRMESAAVPVHQPARLLLAEDPSYVKRQTLVD